jgi:hypothetical protein
MQKGIAHFRPSGHARPALSAAVALAMALFAAGAHGQTHNPGYDRPGLGFTPAVLGPGDLTVEQGLPDASLDSADGVTSRQLSADTLVRLGVGGPFELQLASSPWNRLATWGTSRGVVQGRGSSSLGVKFALPDQPAPLSWGLLGSVTFTDGDPALRAGRRQYLLGAQGNWQITDHQSIGAYAEDVREGSADSTTLALSDTLALTPAWSVYVETASVHAAGHRHGLLGGGGLAWMATPRVQLDAGVDHRLQGDADRWLANLGVSIYFGR